MGVNPIDYPHQWAPTEFTCSCGTKCRVDVEFSGWAEVMNFYRHCAKAKASTFQGASLQLRRSGMACGLEFKPLYTRKIGVAAEVRSSW